MIEIAHDADSNTALLGGQPLVFHCHFYNCALQEAIEAGLGEDAGDVQRAAAQEAVRLSLAELGGPGAEVLGRASALFRQLGFGTLDLAGVGPRGGLAYSPSSHYAMGWVATRGTRPTPACAFVEGFVAAAVIVAHGLTPERVRVREAECFACGAERCAFRVEVR
ncbi:MAG: hypothetical protein KF729_17990 [Sandaracinaceae bacterium]|nr:hypothetical protein [Sandaracinaceae bacterium]